MLPEISPVFICPNANSPVRRSTRVRPGRTVNKFISACYDHGQVEPMGELRFPILLLLSLPCFAHDVITTKITWSREVSRLVYKHCASCHRDGGAAFSLMT